jgi:hypothetical protein
MKMNVQERATQAEEIARTSLGRLSDKRLAETWMLTNSQPATREVTITRGWLLDELEARMNRRDSEEVKHPAYLGAALGRFDRWLEAECNPASPVSPLPYLT